MVWFLLEEDKQSKYWKDRGQAEGREVLLGLGRCSVSGVSVVERMGKPVGGHTDQVRLLGKH